MLDLPYKAELFNSFKTYPNSRLMFVTVRDSTLKYNMNKVINWITKRCDTLCVVRGLNGGEHYHLLAGLKDRSWSPVCSRGVHFHISYLGGPSNIIIPTDMERQEADYVKHIEECRRDGMSTILKVPFICTAISLMIREHFAYLHRKAKQIKAKNKKENNISRVLDYLELNLNENESIIRYVTSYEKYPIKHHIKSVNKNLWDGIRPLATLSRSGGD